MEYLVLPKGENVSPSCIDICVHDVCVHDVCVHDVCDGYCSSYDLCGGYMTRNIP